MTAWIPKPIWQGKDVFIIGGGSSLRGFDWSLLKKEHTIGCNQAFRLGPEVCDICIFCDKKFILKDRDPRRGFYDELAKFPNPVVTNNNQLVKYKITWLKHMPRKVRGLGTDSLGYNKNTGAAAINLALILGASTIYLLGFDMHLDTTGRPNWHDRLLDKANEKTYKGMIKGFDNLHKDLEIVFPGRKIFNVTNKSDLNIFPKINFDTFWKERRTNVA